MNVDGKKILMLGGGGGGGDTAEDTHTHTDLPSHNAGAILSVTSQTSALS